MHKNSVIHISSGDVSLSAKPVKVVSLAGMMESGIMMEKIKVSYESPLKATYKTVTISPLKLDRQIVNIKMERESNLEFLSEGKEDAASSIDFMTIPEARVAQMSNFIRLLDEDDAVNSFVESFKSDVALCDIAGGDCSMNNYNIKYTTSGKKEYYVNFQYSDNSLDLQNSKNPGEANNAGFYSLEPYYKFQADLVELERKTKQEMELTESVINEDLAEAIYKKMFLRFPIMKNTQPLMLSEEKEQKVVDIIMSRVYGKSYGETEMLLSKAIGLSKDNVYLRDMLKLITLMVAQGTGADVISEQIMFVKNNYVLYTNHAGFNMLYTQSADDIDEDFAHYREQDIDGFYSKEYNIAVFEDVRSFTHEVAHAIANILFNNESLPVKEGDEQMRELYHNAVASMFEKVGHRLGVDESTSFKNVQPLMMIKVLHNESKLKLFADSKTYEEQNELEKFIDENNISYSEMELFTELANYFTTGAVMGYFDCASKACSEMGNEKILVEVFPRLPQFVAQGIRPDVVLKYFGDLHQFWTDYITPVVEHFEEIHSNACDLDSGVSGVDGLYSESFKYCVIDFQDILHHSA